MYSVRKDTLKKRIYVKLAGFLEVEEAKRYAKEVVEAAESFHQQNAPFTLVADLTEMKTASKEVAEVLSGVQEATASKGLRKSAVLLPAEAVGSMQIKRYSRMTEVEEVQEYFSNLSEAEEFLDK